MSSETALVVALGFSCFALAVSVALAVHVGRLRRGYDVLVGGRGDTGFAATGRRQALLADELRVLREEVTAARAGLSDALRHVAVVRYDAFGGGAHGDGTAGGLSFSAALLDDAGDGLVLTSITGRAETRTYAKGVTGGRSEHALSPEEQQAIDKARSAGASSWVGA